MQRSKKEMLKLTAKEVLYTLVDVSELALAICDKSGGRKRSFREYFREREVDRSNFRQKIQYLKTRGFIEVFIEGKEKYFELTEKGRKDSLWFNMKKIIESERMPWDGLFRVVIFDVPEKHKSLRDMIRKKLHEIGFIQIQESVLVYPFPCKQLVNTLIYYYSAKPYIKYLIADVVEGEEEIIEHFIDAKILNKSDLKCNKIKVAA